MCKNNCWNMLNHMPNKAVKKVVTDKILQFDRNTCDLLLKKILD